MLILASTSRYRRELLQRLGLPFEVIAPLVDESGAPPESALERAQRLALAKARAVSVQRPDATVIGSDQVAHCKGRTLDKPGNAQRCREQLRWLSASSAVFHSAVALLPARGAQPIEFVATTTVHFRALSSAEIERYIVAEQPFDCAGAFRSEALGISLFERIECEDPTALIGLPLIGLAAALRALDFAVP